MGHGAEQWMEGFARLKIDGAVLDLEENVCFKLAVQRLEFVVGLPGPVFVRRAVDKSAPDYDAVVGSQRIGQHIGAVGMGSSVVLRARLTFGISFYEESAEVRDVPVD